MSAGHRSPAQAPRDPDLAGAQAAMHRAAMRARRRAEAAAKVTDSLDRSPVNSGGARKEEGPAAVDALRTLREAGLGGAASHLHSASERIDAGDWAGSVRESIHAVESVVRRLDPTSSQSLRSALVSLETRGTLHPALTAAFDTLYGYTSDEQGVRHATLDPADSSVGRDEAVFMLGACASFAGYMWRKHKAGEAN